MLSKPPLVDVEHLHPITRSWIREASVLGMVSEHIVVARYELGQGYSVSVYHRLSPSSITNLGRRRPSSPNTPNSYPRLSLFFKIMYTRGVGSQNVVLLLYDRPITLRRGIYGVYTWKPYL